MSDLTASINQLHARLSDLEVRMEEMPEKMAKLVAAQTSMTSEERDYRRGVMRENEASEMRIARTKLQTTREATNHREFAYVRGAKAAAIAKVQLMEEAELRIIATRKLADEATHQLFMARIRAVATEGTKQSVYAAIFAPERHAEPPIEEIKTNAFVPPAEEIKTDAVVPEDHRREIDALVRALPVVPTDKRSCLWILCGTENELKVFKAESTARMSVRYDAVLGAVGGKTIYALIVKTSRAVHHLSGTSDLFCSALSSTATTIPV